VASNLPLEDFVFSAGGGFLFGAVAGYAIKKVMKIAAVVVGLFVAALAYLSYKGLIDIKWIAMENATRSGFFMYRLYVITFFATSDHDLRCSPKLNNIRNST